MLIKKLQVAAIMTAGIALLGTVGYSQDRWTPVRPTPPMWGTGGEPPGEAQAKPKKKEDGKASRVCGFLYVKDGNVYVDEIEFMAGASRYHLKGELVKQLKQKAKPPLSWAECRKEGLIGSKSCGTTFSKQLIALEGHKEQTGSDGNVVRDSDGNVVSGGHVGGFRTYMTGFTVTKIVWENDTKTGRKLHAEMLKNGKEVLDGQSMKEAAELEEKGEAKSALAKYKMVLDQFRKISSGAVRLEDLLGFGAGLKEYNMLLQKIGSLSRDQAAK